MKKTVLDLIVEGKVVLVRVDFNVPLKNGVITDDNRIVCALPTINYLVENGAKVVLMSHLGKIDHKDPEKKEAGMKKNNMAPVAARLAELVTTKVSFSPATRGEGLANAVAALNNGEILVVQNTRYEKGESKNDPELAKEWASLCDAFVMDAFGSAHRAHASTYGVPEILNADGRDTAIGFLVEKEVKSLSKCVFDAERPYVAILGGAKVSSKIKVIESLLTKVDYLIIGGAMAYTFSKAQGHSIGTSLCEDDQIDFANKCLEQGKGKLFLPIDRVISNDFENPTEIRTTSVEDLDIPEGFMGADIGPKTCELFADIIKKAKTVFWNGPMGIFEDERFAKGTIEVCKAITETNDCFTVIGGGDSAAAAAQLGFKEKFSHVSTGGGASLEMIENDGHLPGIDIIQDK